MARELGDLRSAWWVRNRRTVGSVEIGSFGVSADFVSGRQLCQIDWSEHATLGSNRLSAFAGGLPICINDLAGCSHFERKWGDHRHFGFATEQHRGDFHSGHTLGDDDPHYFGYEAEHHRRELHFGHTA